MSINDNPFPMMVVYGFALVGVFTTTRAIVLNYGPGAFIGAVAGLGLVTFVVAPAVLTVGFGLLFFKYGKWK